MHKASNSYVLGLRSSVAATGRIPNGTLGENESGCSFVETPGTLEAKQNEIASWPPARLVANRISQFWPPTPSSRVPGKSSVARRNFGHGYQEKFGGILYHTKGVWKGEKFLSISLLTPPLKGRVDMS